MRILITGGAGFIGSAVIRHFLQSTKHTVINVDKLTYAANLTTHNAFKKHSRYIFEQHDICDRHALAQVLTRHQPDAIIHLAAESHVDRSISAPQAFVQTNIVGTYVLLEVCHQYWSKLQPEKKDKFLFHHVSTDEVFGDLLQSAPPFTESSNYNPSSPYSASKAGSDHLVKAWYRTYGLPAIISHCSNNYGPHQFPEKLIPLTILHAIQGKNIPIFGNGHQVRDWIYVDDHAEAIHSILMCGEPGETYNIGGNSERRNIDVVKAICDILDNLHPVPDSSYHDLITHVEDRLGHDKRYAINSAKALSQLKWQPNHCFDEGLKKTVIWYLNNVDCYNNQM